MILAQSDLEWVSHIGDNGVATAMVIFGVILGVIWLLVTRSNNAVRMREMALREQTAQREHTLATAAQQERLALEAETAREQVKIERQRTQAESDQATALNRLRVTLDTTGVALERISTLIATAPTRQDLQDAIHAMHERSAVTDGRFDTVDATLGRIQADVQVVPQETVRLLDPQALINDLRATLQDGMTQNEHGLAQRLETMGAEMSPVMRGFLNQEIQQYAGQVQRQFDKVEAMLRSLRKDLAREGTDAGVPNETPTSPPGPLSRQAGEGEQHLTDIQRPEENTL